ncbi:F-box/LRR-repeat protein 7 isoform X2 [Anabrus simplex]
MAGEICIEVLPDEVLVEIFSHVPFKDMVFSVQRVCTRWRDVSRDIMLWKSIIYCPNYRESDNEIADILRRIPNLRILVLDRAVQAVVLNAFMQNCPNISSLELSGNQKISTKLLKNILMKYSSLDQLGLPSSVLSKLELVQIIGQFNHLKTLIFSGWSFEDEPMDLLLRPIADGCPALECVDIRGKLVMYDELAYLIEKKGPQLHNLCMRWCSQDRKCNLPLLSKCTALKSLHIDSYCEIGVEEGFKALQRLKTVTSLTFFVLHNAQVSSVMSIFSHGSMSQLQEFTMSYFLNYEDKLTETIIRHCPQLKLLCIEQCPRLTDRSVENLHLLTELQTVSLSGAAITDTSIMYLRKCQNLRSLSLKYCMKLTEESMKQMANFSNLRTLNLDYCVVGGLPLHLISTHMKQLTLLSIRNCPEVDKEAVAELRKKMPHLTVNDEVHFGLGVEDDWEIVGSLYPSAEDDDVYDEDCILFNQLRDV